MGREIQILLVDDHALLRDSLRALLSYYDDLLVVGEAQDGAEALAKVEALKPDVILMDVAMQRMNGLEATRLISQRFPNSRVLILSQHEDRQYVLPLLHAGAAGYILKRALGTDLISAIRAVYRGETYLHPSVSTILLDEMRRRQTPGSVSPDALTGRELQVLKLIVQGMTNSQIALALTLSVKTVEWHRANLMSKLDTHNTADLVRYALQHRLINDVTGDEPY
jgi:DNA-binding NarL/FixJ family response regulator